MLVVFFYFIGNGKKLNGDLTEKGGDEIHGSEMERIV